MEEGRDEVYIRQATPLDVESIYQVHVGSIRGVCGKSSNYTPEQIELWVNRQSKERYAEPIDRGRILVACKESDGSVRGFGHYEFSDESTMEIKALYVSSDCVGKGMGSLFMGKFNELADKNGNIKRMVVASTANAVKFYEKNGFVLEGESLHCESGCVSINCIKMSKMIS